jgi:hypothetical protein
VPIVGRELLRTSIDGKAQSVPVYLARQLCERAGLSWTTNLERLSDPIGKMVERLLESPKGRNWPYTALCELTADLEGRTDPPQAGEACVLQRLASVQVDTTPNVARLMVLAAEARQPRRNSD